MLSMVIFVRGVAVLVGLANVYWYGLYNGVHDASLSGLPRSELLVEVCVTVVTGLVISEIVLRFARPALQGGFYARYAAAAATVFLGGLTLGASLPMALVFISSTGRAQHRRGSDSRGIRGGDRLGAGRVGGPDPRLSPGDYPRAVSR